MGQFPKHKKSVSRKRKYWFTNWKSNKSNICQLHEALLELHGVFLELLGALSELHGVFSELLGALSELHGVFLELLGALLELHGALLELLGALLELHEALWIWLKWKSFIYTYNIFRTVCINKSKN